MSDNAQHPFLNGHGRPVRFALIAVLGMLAIFLLAETVDVVKGIGEPPPSPSDTIVVSGQGKATAIPDIVTITYTITKTADTVADAQAEATHVEDAALTFLKKQGVAEADVRTTSYEINPHYEYHTCFEGVCPAPKITGYDVSQAVSVKVRDIKTVGDVIGGLGEVGVTNLSGPSFAVDDPTSVEAQARAEAITKAKAQAKELAGQLGVRLVRIVYFNEQTPSSPPIPYGMGGGESFVKAAAPSVPTGQNEYTV
ncbi:MAG TPA: SIMPL domain-containing protein, partial [Candidatus Paceibacterota bacterium]